MRNEILGFQIIRNSSDNNPYTLVGKRGARYNLWRNQNDRRLMYVTNKNGNICGIKGNYTFTDKLGDLEALSAGAWLKIKLSGQRMSIIK